MSVYVRVYVVGASLKMQRVATLALKIFNMYFCVLNNGLHFPCQIYIKDLFPFYLFDCFSTVTLLAHNCLVENFGEENK